jgi:hypothetical protein
MEGVVQMGLMRGRAGSGFRSAVSGRTIPVTQGKTGFKAQAGYRAKIEHGGRESWPT